MVRGTWYSVAWVAAGMIASVVARAEDSIRLQGAGATFPAPLYKRWVAEYQQQHSNVAIDYQSIGSGGGIKNFTDKTVDFGATDAAMNKKELAAAGGPERVIEFPAAAGAVVPAYNLPGVADMKFTGDLLAQIYLGKVTTWNDPAIAKINPGVSLPPTAITPVYRTDGSGHHQHLDQLPLDAKPRLQRQRRHGQGRAVPHRPGRQGERGRDRRRPADARRDRLRRGKLRRPEPPRLRLGAERRRAVHQGFARCGLGRGRGSGGQTAGKPTAGQHLEPVRRRGLPISSIEHDLPAGLHRLGQRAQQARGAGLGRLPLVGRPTTARSSPRRWTTPRCPMPCGPKSRACSAT